MSDRSDTLPGGCAAWKEIPGEPLRELSEKRLGASTRAMGIEPAPSLFSWNFHHPSLIFFQSIVDILRRCSNLTLFIYLCGLKIVASRPD